MNDFIDKLGKKVSDVANDFSKKADETIEIQKKKGDIRSLERGNERDYAHIGRMVYEKFKSAEVVDLDYITLCESIEKREEEIKKIEDNIKDIKGQD
ncbi:MAG TPA: hypothetical protein H9887_03620 [Candidatus Dorea intestinavium]|nr:hypothetical protein [Candidatus Dorea intestinavium]